MQNTSHFKYEMEDVDCKFCTEYRGKKRGCAHAVCPWLGERIKAGTIGYEEALQDLQHPQDTAHARIYDRLLEMCAPIRFSGENFRKATAQDKLARLKNLMD